MAIHDQDWYQRLRIAADQLATRVVGEIVEDLHCVKQRQRRHCSLQMGSLEPRVLFSATPLDPAILDASGEAGDEAAMVMTVEVGEDESSEIAQTSSQKQSATELIIIDSYVPGLQELLDDLSQSRPEASVFVLDPTRDGVQQITEILDTHSGLASVHIVSHGEDSAVRLGNVWLGNDNLSAYAGEIAQWQSALSSDADILFYGCDLAANADGRDFLESMQALTNADIAASDDITGHENLGGDWDLEFQLGTLETDIAFSMQLQGAWEHELAGVVIDVTILEDIVDGGDGETSLREAVSQAIAGDTIRLGAGVHLVDNSIDLSRGFAIVGMDARSTIIDANGATGDRVFNVDNSAVVDISRLTIQGGNENNGGAIFVDDGTLNLSDAILRNNSSNEGGAIHVHGIANLNRVLMTGNTATGDGGAIHFHSDGGGSLTNVTISGNTSDGDGGGVFVDTSATVTITNSTIVANDAFAGGGISNADGTIVIRNTIVAENTANNSQKDVVGAFSSDGSNLFGVTNGSSGLSSDTVSANVGLLSLGNYGGQTDTHALQAGSVAIDAGTFSGAPSIDARGISRDSQRDVGAFEATSSLFWLSTRDNSTSPSGAPGLDSWNNGEVLQLSDPNLQLGPDGTDGTFTSAFNLEAFADDSDLDIDGLHYVTRNITLGTTTTIDLQPGDLLISTRESETFNSGAFTVDDTDIFLFRPDSPGEYHSGTFSMVLSGLNQLTDPELSVVTDIWSFSLVEQDTIFGDTTLSAGDFLFTMADDPRENDIFVFHTIDVGDGTTDGTADRLIEGNDIGIAEEIIGLELIETTTTVGGEMVQAGELLVSVGRAQSSVGTNGISVDRHDVFRLQVSQTTLVAGTAVADAAILLDGSSLGLDTNQEDINALALIPSTASAGTTIAYEGFDYAAGSLNGQNGGSGWLSGWTLESGGSAQVDATGLTAPNGLEPGIGGTLEMDTSGQFEQRRDLATTLGADGTTAWFSFLLKPDGTGPGGISLLIGDGTGADNTVNVGTTGNDFLVGVDSSASGVKIDNVVVDAQTYFLVVQIDFEAGDDTVTLYVDPTPSGSSPDSPGSLTTQLTTADLGTFSRLAVVGGFGGNNSNIDEIRVGTSFRSVAPLEPNRTPSDISLDSTSVDENTNTTGGYSLGVLAALDPDAGETFTWQVIGGADVSHFGIGGASSNELIFDDSVLDYETQTSYEVTVRVTDSGANTYDKTLTINVVDQNDVAPVIDASQSFDINEDTVNTTSVGTVTATDPDTVGTLSNWTITSGNTANAFAINANTGEITVNDTSAIDYENIQSYTLGIRVSDGTNPSAIQNVTIAINDANDTAPVITAGQSASSLENAPNNTSVITVTATDPDTIGTLSNWTITSGNTGNAFAINANTGEVTVNDASAIDYENIQSYTLGIRVGDGTNPSAIQNVTIAINDANDTAPVITAGQSASILETAPNNTSVMTVTATDPDTVGTLSNWTITSGNTGNAFAINTNTGEITVNDTSAIDFENIESYTLGISVSDGTNPSAIQNVTIAINDANDNAPVITAGQSASILETAPNNTSVMTVTATDPDTVGTLSNWTITSGNTANAFAINANTGEITVNDTSAIDYENIQSYTLGIRVSDGTNPSAIQNITIAINDANDTAPVITAGQSASILENAPNDTSVITVAATDPDTIGTLSNWTITSGNTGNAFAINANTGEITVNDTSAIDFENIESYTLGIRVSDGTNTSAILNVTIQIIDTNDAVPVVTAGQNASVSDSAANSTPVLTVAATDSDAGSVFSSWAIVSGNTNNAFSINADTGEIRVNDSSQLDFASAASYALGVTVSDGTNTSSTQNVNIQITDGNNNNPVVGAGQTANVAEDVNDGTAVTTVLATDNDAGTVFSQWAIVSGNASGLFEIDANSGEIRVRDSSQLDYESTSSYSLGITVSDGENTSASRDVVVQVVNANDPATGRPVILGDTTVGSTLEVDVSGIEDQDGVGTPVYQWFRDGVEVGSTTPGSYLLTNADRGFEIGVTVSFIDANGNPEGPLASDQTAIVTADPNARPLFIPPSPPPQPVSPSSDAPSRESTDSSSKTNDAAESESQSETDSSNDSDTTASDKAVKVRANAKSEQEGKQAKTDSGPVVIAVVATATETSDDGELAGQVVVSDGPIAARDSSSQTRWGRSSQSSQSDFDSDLTRIDNEGAALAWVDMVALTRPGAMWDDLDQRRNAVESQIQGDLIVVGSAGAAASSFTVGVVAWAMRSGFLVTGLIAHMPAWSGVDPLMIMQGMSSDGSTETLEELMDRQSKAMDAEEAQS